MKIDRLLFSLHFFSIILPIIYSHANDFDISLVETSLIRKLLNESTYLKKVRPSHKVIVHIRLIFNQIISMVEKEQVIVTNCFVDQKWMGMRDE